MKADTRKINIEETVVGIINAVLFEEYKRNLKQDSNGVWKSYEFKGDLGLNSLQVVEIFMECEHTFNIKFDDEEIMLTTTIKGLIEKIEKKF